MRSDQPKVLFEALTYDDVLLLPAYSEVLPRNTVTTSQLTRNIQLNVPLVSAARLIFTPMRERFAATVWQMRASLT